MKKANQIGLVIQNGQKLFVIGGKLFNLKEGGFLYSTENDLAQNSLNYDETPFANAILHENIFEEIGDMLPETVLKTRLIHGIPTVVIEEGSEYAIGLDIDGTERDRINELFEFSYSPIINGTWKDGAPMHPADMNPNSHQYMMPYQKTYDTMMGWADSEIEDKYNGIAFGGNEGALSKNGIDLGNAYGHVAIMVYTTRRVNQESLTTVIQNHGFIEKQNTDENIRSIAKEGETSNQYEFEPYSGDGEPHKLFGYALLLVMSEEQARDAKDMNQDEFYKNICSPEQMSAI